MNTGSQKEEDFRSGGTKQEQRHDPYGRYIPEEIPIPDIGNTDRRPGYLNFYTRQQNKYQAQGQMYAPPKDNRIKFRILLAAVCAAFLLCACVGTGIAYIRNTPAYRLSKAVQNLAAELEEAANPLTEKAGIEELLWMLAEEGGHISTQINFTADELIGNTIGVDTEYYKNMQDKELSADTSISMMNYEFAHLNIYADEEAFCFSIPELFLEDIYVNNENVVSQYNASFFAGLSGRSNLEDFSIDLFPDIVSKNYFPERYAADLEACRDTMVMERVERGVYRVVFPVREMERLLRAFMESSNTVYAASESGQWWQAYNKLLTSDICLLFEINRRNRIESITFAEPVRMLDGKAAMSGSLHFLGNSESTEKVQGEITVEGEDGVARSLYLQSKRSGKDDSYGLEVEAELMEEADSILRMKYSMDSDTLRDTFTTSLSLWNDEEDLELVLEGELEDIVRGRSLELEVESLQFYTGGEEVFKITGDILLEPLEDEVMHKVGKKTALFEMTESDWLGILYKISDTYGELLNALW